MRPAATPSSPRPLTYAEVGRSLGELPPGYSHVRRSAVVGYGAATFERAVAALLAWQVQRAAGLRVRPTHPTVRLGAEAEQTLGLGPLAVRAPVRVVAVVEETGRRGFAYGTLPGHAECGEEAFVVELGAGGEVTFTVAAFSRPATWLLRAAGPLGRLGQQVMTTRYLRALRRLARPQTTAPNANPSR